MSVQPWEGTAVSGRERTPAYAAGSIFGSSLLVLGDVLLNKENTEHLMQNSHI